MKELIIPSKLNPGDKVAFISISGGRAGDEDMLPRYMLGKRRFEKIFNVEVVETPHALCGREYIYEHPEKRPHLLIGRPHIRSRTVIKNSSVRGFRIQIPLKIRMILSIGHPEPVTRCCREAEKSEVILFLFAADLFIR